MSLGPQIIELRNQGKTYWEIKDILNCSLGTICYHCRDGQKSKINTAKKLHRTIEHPYAMKLVTFKSQYPNEKYISNYKQSAKKLIQLKINMFHTNRKIKMSQSDMTFTVQDIINKFGEKPRCYLTGIEIDIYQTKSYQFDHIVPVSRGGTNTLDNLGICTRNANMAKSDMTVEEFHELCKNVVNNLSGKDRN